jgi:4-amino-4-deoxy-L-arabinose transferase-like glycosyltransferase
MSLLAVVLLVATLARLIALDALPPGINYDLASNGVFALNILWNGARPFYINHVGAPEPLMIYLQALSVWLFGVNVTALRAVSAVANILSVAALYGVARASTQDRRIALVAAFALAVSPELVHIARMGLRFTLVPFLEAATLLFFWRGWSDGARRDFVLAGVFLGLALYAYLAALMLPAVIFVLWLHQFLVARARWRARLPLILLMFLVTALIALPRVFFQLMYPEAAFLRASQVSLLQNPGIQQIGLGNVILAHLLEYVRMFGIEWQGGSFARPLFDPLLFAFFLIGVAICLARWRRIEWFWAPLTMAVMFLPDLLAANEPTPNKLRTIGVVLPAFFFVGVGAFFLLDRIAHRARALGYVALIVVLAWSAVSGLSNYCFDRATALAPREVDDFNVSRTETAIAEWIIRQTEPVYLPLNEYTRTPEHFLIGAHSARLQTARAESAPARAWIVLPLDPARPRTEGLVYIHDPWSFVLVADDAVRILPPTRSDIPTGETQLRARQPDQVIRDAQGSSVAYAYAVDGSNNPLQFRAIAGNAAPVKFSQGIALVAASLDTPRIQPGEIVRLTLFWQATQKIADSYAIFVHLIDLNEETVSNADVLPALNGYLTYLWKPGEIIPTHHQIKVPARTRPGKYRVEVGLYNGLDHNRLSVLDEKGNGLDTRVIVGAAKVAPAQPHAYNPPHLQRANFADQLALSGYAIEPADAPREFRVTLYWQGLAEMSRDYTVFVHVLDANGKIVAQADHQPQNGNYPSSIWDAGESVRDDFSLALPGDAPSGKYTIAIGWYDLETGLRLPVRDANNQPVSDHVILDSTLEVR